MSDDNRDQMIDSAETALALWGNGGLHVIKGRTVLDKIQQDRKAWNLTVTVVPVRHFEEAVELERRYSEEAKAIGDRYRLQQAEELLREAGYVEGPDGAWAKPEA